jgi:hypothetical protein
VRIGYARVSTDDQNLDLQRDALKQARVEKTYEDKALGKNLDGPQLGECLRSLRKGDTLIVWRLRPPRPVKDLESAMNYLAEPGHERNHRFAGHPRRMRLGLIEAPGIFCGPVYRRLASEAHAPRPH